MLDKDERRLLIEKLDAGRAEELLRHDGALRAVEFGARLAGPGAKGAYAAALDKATVDASSLADMFGGKREEALREQVAQLEKVVEELRERPTWNVPMLGQTLRVTKPDNKDYPGILKWEYDGPVDVRVSGWGSAFDTNNKTWPAVAVDIGKMTYFIPLDHLNKTEASRG